MTAARLPNGGRIDRDRPIGFEYDGRAYQGFAGDTLASALLANGVVRVGRSFKRHRPRGLLSLGFEEPNALVNLGQGAMTAPNRMATEIPLAPGLEARSARGWPSSRFDLGAVFDLAPAAVAAGFYYKTFMGPGLPGVRDAWNRLWEPMLRHLAGEGDAPTGRDPDVYRHRNIHVDVAIVGAGLAGMAAARAATVAGQRVAIFERDFLAGGRGLSAPDEAIVEGQLAADWAGSVWRRLAASKRAIARSGATAFGLYDSGFLAAFEAPGPDAAPGDGGVIWHVRAKRVVLAAGALERPMVFPGNDRPGVMLSGAVEAAVRRYAIRPGRRAVVYSNHTDDGAELALRAAGADIVDRVGVRETIVGVMGRAGVLGARIAPLLANDAPDLAAARAVSADLIVTSGGWSPALALHLIQGGRQRWSAEDGCFVAAPGGQTDLRVVGAAAARFSAAAAVSDGHAAGVWAAGGREVISAPVVANGARAPSGQGLPLASVQGRQRRQAFIDMQHDVTLADIDLAAREGFRSIEHAKRYTTSGMGTDQGRTAQLATAAALAEATGRTVYQVGLSGLRPPVSPVPFGALGGRRTGSLFHPARTTPMHARHMARNAVFEDVGDWKRARYYDKRGIGMRDVVAAECAAVRKAVGVLDVSTLGKIDVAGRDAPEFLNRVYTNLMDDLPVGACRYGLMLKDDGMVFDDGVVARIGPTQYHLTTTSGGAGNVLDWLEDLRQTEWPELKVRLASVTEQWAGIAVAGPAARRVAAALAPDVDLASAAFPHMAWRSAEILGAAGRIFRVSFSGELGYELNVPWRHGQALWDAALAAGAKPYGTEAMHVLRAEKGFIVVGHETDGTVTPRDLGMGWMLSKKKPDFIGKRGLERPALKAAGRKQLVGLEPEDPSIVLDEGAQLIARADPRTPEPMLGHVTSSYWSAGMGRGFAMALLVDGRKRHGERLFAWSLGQAYPVTVGKPVFVDPDGERLNA